MLPHSSGQRAGVQDSLHSGIPDLKQASSSMPLLSRASTTLPSKITTALSTQYADAEFRRNISFLDDQIIANDAETRRHLRLKIQKEVIDSNAAIINDFGRAAEQLRRIGSTIVSLNKAVQNTKIRLSVVSSEAETSLQEARSLWLKKDDLDTRQLLLSAFTTRFVLTTDEIALLTLAAEHIDEPFFAALTRAKCIIKDSEIVLGFENQTIGLELMDNVTKIVKLAYQKLYKWVQREFKTLNLENPQMDSSIRKALRVLAERPSLFQSCLSFFAEARERILLDLFLTALSGNTSSGVAVRSVKPIEMTAHDPLRYVGDMLAWVHSAAVSEQEALGFLFMSEKDEIIKGLKSGKEAEPWHIVLDDEETVDFDADKALNELVDRDLSGVARVLRQQMGQVIQSNEEVIPAYKLANLLGFYTTTFKKLLSGTSVVTETVSNTEAEAFRQFRCLIRDRLLGFQADLQQAPSDLRPPVFLRDALDQIFTIMQTYETSLSTHADREADFQPVLHEVFEPFMAGCINMARNLDSPADNVFLVNCYMACISTLCPFTFARNKVTELRGGMAVEIEKLALAQYNFFRRGSGLDSIITAVENASQMEDCTDQLRKTDSFQPDTLRQAAQIFDDFLPSALMDAIDNITQIQDSSLARRITEEAAENFCRDFALLEDNIQRVGQAQIEDEVNMGVLSNIFPRKTGEVKVLLS